VHGFHSCQDSREAHFHLAQLYEYGAGGLPQEYNQALALYRKSAQSGYVAATYHLGLMVAFGRGRKQDYREAFTLFQDAAQKVSACHQFILVRIHISGSIIGVTQSSFRNVIIGSE